MNTHRLIGGIIVSTLVTMGAAQADNITTRDDLFAYLKIGKANSTESVETQKCKYLESRDAGLLPMGAVQTGNIITRDDLFYL